jgi:hypothetical protein
MMNFIRFLFFVGLFLTAQAYSAIMIDPSIGTNIGYNLEGNGVDEDFGGTGVGGRFGLDYVGVMFGIDYHRHTGELEQANGNKLDASLTETAVFVGYDAPILFRVWAAMLVKGEFDVENGSDYTDGKGMKFGVGFTMLPFVSLNLEHRSFEYEKRGDVAGAETYKNKGMFLSVSLPLSF